MTMHSWTFFGFCLILQKLDFFDLLLFSSILPSKKVVTDLIIMANYSLRELENLILMKLPYVASAVVIE
jgi:hypothetical protein